MGEIAKKANLGDSVIARINELCKQGMTLPQGYNHVNAIKASLIKLSETKDRTGRPFTEVCTPASIQTALMDMAQNGLDVSKNQGYFSVYGNQLKFMKQYQGVSAKIKEYFPKYTPCPQVVYEGDVFEVGISPETGRRYLVKHEQSPANLDNDFAFAYMYTPCEDGGMELYVMTKKMVMEAWMQSNNKTLAVHKRFTDKMVKKTVINTALKPILESMMDAGVVNVIEGKTEEAPQEIVDLDTDDVEIVEEAEADGELQGVE